MNMNAELIQQLVDLGCGKLKHINLGLCPDAIEGHETRDEECPACQALVAGQALANALAGGACIPSALPAIDQVQALDGRIFAMLSTFESQVLSFYRAQGRKCGVAQQVNTGGAITQRELLDSFKSASGLTTDAAVSKVFDQAHSNVSAWSAGRKPIPLGIKLRILDYIGFSPETRRFVAVLGDLSNHLSKLEEDKSTIDSLQDGQRKTKDGATSSA